MTPENKRIAKYAAIGAVVAIPLPIIGPIIGGIAGAVIANNKNKKDGLRAY